MSLKYTQLQKDAATLINEISKYPAGLNDEASTKANNILQYASQRTLPTIDIDYDVKDKQTRFTYSEMLSFIDLYTSKKTELEILRSGLIKSVPPKPLPGDPAKPTTKTYTAQLP